MSLIEPQCWSCAYLSWECFAYVYVRTCMCVSVPACVVWWSGNYKYSSVTQWSYPLQTVLLRTWNLCCLASRNSDSILPYIWIRVECATSSFYRSAHTIRLYRNRFDRTIPFVVHITLYFPIIFFTNSKSPFQTFYSKIIE